MLLAVMTGLTHWVYSSRKSTDDQWTFVAELLDSIIVCNDQLCNPNSETMTILHHNKKATGTVSIPARCKSTGYVAPPAHGNNDAVSKRTRSSSSHK